MLCQSLKLNLTFLIELRHAAAGHEVNLIAFSARYLR